MSPTGGANDLFTSALFTLTGNELTLQFENLAMPLNPGTSPFTLEAAVTPWDNSTPEMWDQGAKLGICVQSCNMASGWTISRSEGDWTPMPNYQGSASSMFGDAPAPNVTTYTMVLPSSSSVLSISPATWASAPDAPVMWSPAPDAPVMWTSAPDIPGPAQADAPEPATWGLMASALAGLLAAGLRRR